MRSRRQFLQSTVGSTAVLSFGATVPRYLAAAAAATERQEESVLVMIQLSGGNDGLNTVIPFQDPLYRRRRPNLAISETSTLAVEPGIGLHPALRGLADELEAGRLAIVQGVGYPNPNRSHFESMDIWHTCRRKSGGPRHDGWLGRYLDAAAAGQDLATIPALHLGEGKQPLALAALNHQVPSVKSLDEFQVKARNGDLFQSLRTTAAAPRAQTDSLLEFVQATTSSALQASERVQQAVRSLKQADHQYPDTQLAKQLQIVARLIDADLQTRVFYLELDGFDTHSQQPDAHAGLLRTLGDAVHAFMQDLGQQGNQERVTVAAFSEFGRRVEENASGGTDHGAAGPLFLIGPRVRGGLIGDHPSLSQLHQGDLKYHTDFRRVYAALLAHWLKWPQTEVALQGEFAPLDVFRSA